MRTEIRNELIEVAAFLADVGNENCYRVPGNYFEELADEIMSKIQLPFTHAPLTPPAPAYFAGLADTIINKIKSNGIIVEEDNEAVKELAELSPVLAEIKKVNVYTVPMHYFADFKVAAPSDKQVKVVAMRQPAQWMRYAVAAAVIAFIVVYGIFYFRNNDSNAGNKYFTFIKDYKKPLSSVSDDAIANYLEESPADVDITPSTYDDSKITAGSLTQQLLQDVSDSDIQEYLQENQQAGEKDIKDI